MRRGVEMNAFSNFESCVKLQLGTELIKFIYYVGVNLIFRPTK